MEAGKCLAWAQRRYSVAAKPLFFLSGAWGWHRLGEMTGGLEAAPFTEGFLFSVCPAGTSCTSQVNLRPVAQDLSGLRHPGTHIQTFLLSPKLSGLLSTPVLHLPRHDTIPKGFPNCSGVGSRASTWGFLTAPTFRFSLTARISSFWPSSSSSFSFSLQAVSSTPRAWQTTSPWLGSLSPKEPDTPWKPFWVFL
jgi:hypothetical protein